MRAKFVYGPRALALWKRNCFWNAFSTCLRGGDVSFKSGKYQWTKIVLAQPSSYLAVAVVGVEVLELLINVDNYLPTTKPQKVTV